MNFRRTCKHSSHYVTSDTTNRFNTRMQKVGTYFYEPGETSSVPYVVDVAWYPLRSVLKDSDNCIFHLGLTIIWSELCPTDSFQKRTHLENRIRSLLLRWDRKKAVFLMTRSVTENSCFCRTLSSMVR
jgi:hypothetical protein